MDWFRGKFTGNRIDFPITYIYIWGFPVKFPTNQSIEDRCATGCPRFCPQRNALNAGRHEMSKVDPAAPFDVPKLGETFGFWSWVENMKKHSV